MLLYLSGKALTVQAALSAGLRWPKGEEKAGPAEAGHYQRWAKRYEGLVSGGGIHPAEEKAGPADAGRYQRNGAAWPNTPSCGGFSIS